MKQDLYLSPDIQKFAMLKNTLNQVAFAALLLLPFSIFCQNLTIDYENPNFIEVCENGEFIIKLTAGSEPATNIQVEVWLPDGITYEPGSVNNATEFDISNLNRPKFTVMDLASFQNEEFDISASASCQIISDINSGKLFANTISVNYNGTDDRIITQPYRVETGLLVITDITPETASGQYGDVINRRITVRNTRFSKIREINLTDFHQGAILISTNGVNPSFDSTHYYATFDASHFTNIGNGDDFFDFNEEFTIVEQIIIDDCGEEFDQSNSYITLTWGCNGDICQSTTRPATINIEEYTKVAKIEFEPSVVTSGDFCDGEDYTEKLLVTNTGNDVASDLLINILGNGTAKDTNTIVVTSGGVPYPFKIQSATPLSDTINCPKDFSGGFVLRFDTFLPNQSFEISWKNVFCDIACDATIPSLGWSHSFLRVCPVDSIQRGIPQNFNGGTDRLLKDSISYRIGRFVENNMQYEFRYDLKSQILDDSMGIINIEFNLPCGYSWSNEPFILGGQAPLNTTINNTGTNTFVSFDFQLPFPDEQVWDNFYLDYDCIDSCLIDVQLNGQVLLSTCPTFFQEGGAPLGTTLVDINLNLPIALVDTNEIKVMTSFISSNPNEDCSLSDCEEFNLYFACESGDIDLTSHPFEAYIGFESEFFRKNIGLKDSNDDRVADNGTPAPRSEIRNDRLLTGDTCISKISGIVVNDLLPIESKNVKFRISFEGHLIDIGNDGEPIRVYAGSFPNDSPLFMSDTGIKDVGAILRIIDKDTGTEYECPMNNILTREDELRALRVVNTRPEVPVDDWRTLSYTYSLNLPSASSIPGSSIPAGFVLEEGDSVYFEAQHRLIYNPRLRVLNLRQHSETILFNESGDVEELYSCGRPRHDWQITGYQIRKNIGNFSALPCDEFDQNVGSNFNLSLGMPNFFTNEVRTLIQIPQWNLNLGFGYELVESNLINIGMNSFPAVVTDQPITPRIQSGIYQFNILQYQNPVFDEGFYFNLYHKFQPLPIACSFEEGSTLQLISLTNYLHDFPEFPDQSLDTVGSTTGFTPLIADLEMIANNPNYVSNDQTATWDVELENKSGNEGRNAWMYLDSRTNRIFDFVLTNTNTGQEIVANNGLYQLGTFDPAEIANYNITSKIDFCGLDSLDIYFGWNCDPLVSYDAFACSRDTFRVNVFAPLPELEMSIASPLDSIELCDTIPFHTIEVFNADLGTAFDLNLKVLMPTGMTILPGSSQGAYSTASGNYITIPDPQDLGNGNYSWEINDFISVINDDGLPGVVNSPFNSFSIRFLGFANCGLIASAPAIANISGKNSCDEPTNTLSKPGEEINIKGVIPDYETNITPDTDAIVNCGDELDLTIRIQASGPTIVGDSILLTLPLGINYITGSYSNVENAIAAEPIIQQRGDFTVLKWAMLDGLPASTNIRFSFKTIGYGEATCQDEVIQVQTIQSKNAFCKTSNSNCPVFVQSGSSLINIDVNYPAWKFTDFNSMVATNGIDYLLNGTNTGDPTQAPLEINFFLDNDGNGFFSMGDMLIATELLSPSDFVNGMFSIAGNLNIDPSEICNVMAVILPENNCTCDLEQIILSGQQMAEMTSITCSEETIQIGVSPVAGANYFWNTPQNLSCFDCPMADFNFINNTDSLQVFNYILTENSGDCPTRHLIEVQVFPIPRIVTPDAKICEGESIQLTTTPAQSVTWSGPGLNNSTVPNPTVTPTQTSIYIANISGVNCSSTDTVVIEVIPGPIADAGRDTSLCNFVGIYKLEALFNPRYSYFWEPNFLLSNFLSHNPTLTSNLSTEFILMVTDENTGCTSTDSVYIDFGVTPEIAVSSDITICSGETVEISANGADTYQWSGGPFVCNDPSCQTVTANPTQTTTYTVIGSTAGMCDAQDSITISISGELTIIDDFRSACIGNSVEINGQFYDQDVSFSDTIKSSQECDTIINYMVSIVEPPTLIQTSFEVPISGDSVTLDQLSNLDPSFSYLWSPSSGLSCSDCQIPNALPESSRVYTVTITSADGCFVTARFDVKKCSAQEIVMPNIFSPNGDSRNQLFCPIGGEYDDVISLKIFNRWGQKIYDGNGNDSKWDGTFKGKPQPVGVYVYIVELGCNGVVEKTLEGDVTLLR